MSRTLSSIPAFQLNRPDRQTYYQCLAMFIEKAKKATWEYKKQYYISSSGF